MCYNFSMDINLTLVSILEGITEFLPVSSTAHLIILSKLFHIDTTDAYIKFYLLFIQLGALLAGIILFSKKALTDRHTFINLCISFVPSAIAGFILYKTFKKLLEGNMILLASMLIIGGLIFILLEKFFIKKASKVDSKSITRFDALVIGFAQAVAIIPGVSRSGATIITGILRGIPKATILEYTFILALPTLGAAVLYDAYKSREMLMQIHDWNILLMGFFVAFVAAFITLSILKKYLSRISLAAFGYYRILLAIFVLSIFAMPAPTVSTPVSVATSSPEVIAEEVVEPSVTVLPEVIYPGDPIFVTIDKGVATKALFDAKEVPIFTYKGKSRILLAIPFEEKNMEHNLNISLDDGNVLYKKISLTPREKIERPLGIPEKLGGNTPAAGKALVDNLALENASINNIKTEGRVLWSEGFGNPLKEMFVTDDYGYNRDTVGYTIVHKGTDYRASVGTDVYAMNDGIVRISRSYTVYGNSVIIDHGFGLSTLYMHLSELKVKEGDIVKKGQLIGLSGKTGYAEAAHLHVSIKVNGVSIDPARFLSFFMI